MRTKTEKQKKKISVKPKASSLKKIGKIYNPSPYLSETKKEKTQYTNIKNKKR